MTKKRKLSLLCASVLLSAVLIVSGLQIYSELSSRQKEKEDFDALAELVQPPAAKPSAAEPIPEETGESVEPIEPAESTRDLSELFRQNSECIGWICIPDTAVNYPVMHTPDNPEKYLRQSFYGEYSVSGVPFLDGRCSLDSGNLILYGHNMKNGTMFSDLRYYADTAFRESHPVIEFQTAGGSKFYTVTEVRITDIYDDRYSQLEVEVRTLTLSTCYGSSKSGRILIIAEENPE